MEDKDGRPLPRVHGTEMEYSISARVSKDQEWYPLDEEVIAHLLALIEEDAGHRIQGGHAENGARIYKDTGGHLEYATPEDVSFHGTCASELAADQMIVRATNKLTAKHIKLNKERIDKITANKRVCDDRGNTWGYHESYCVPARLAANHSDAEMILGPLALHLATRNALVGSGMFLMGEEKAPQLVLSQKFFDLKHDFHCGTTSASKPLVNKRSESHANSDVYNRIHVTSGDPNMSPWATQLKLASTSMLLRTIEQDMWTGYEDLTPTEGWVYAAQTFALDPSLSSTVHFQNGRKYTVLDVQQMIIERTHKLDENSQLPEEESMWLAEWIAITDAMKADPTSQPAKVEWLAKMHYIDQLHDKRDLRAWKPELVSQFDKTWDLLGTGIGERLRETLWQQWMPTAELIISRTIEPPDTTRAKLRGQFITEAFARDESVRGTWEYVATDTQSLHIKDPYQTSL